MAKIARDVMTKRVEFAKNFFLAHPDATVAELNAEFARQGEPKMGAAAYKVRTDARKAAKRGEKAPAAVAPLRSIAPARGLTAPQQDEAKLSQDVMGILNSLAGKIAGSRIQGVRLDVSTGIPTVLIDELIPNRREIRLGESVASLRAAEQPRVVAAPPLAAPAVQAPAATPAPAGGTVTTLPGTPPPAATAAPTPTEPPKA